MTSSAWCIISNPNTEEYLYATGQPCLVAMGYTRNLLYPPHEASGDQSKPSVFREDKQRTGVFIITPSRLYRIESINIASWWSCNFIFPPGLTLLVTYRVASRAAGQAFNPTVEYLRPVTQRSFDVLVPSSTRAMDKVLGRLPGL